MLGHSSQSWKKIRFILMLSCNLLYRSRKTLINWKTHQNWFKTLKRKQSRCLRCLIHRIQMLGRIFVPIEIGIIRVLMWREENRKITCQLYRTNQFKLKKLTAKTVSLNNHSWKARKFISFWVKEEASRWEGQKRSNLWVLLRLHLLKGFLHLKFLLLSSKQLL